MSKEPKPTRYFKIRHLKSGYWSNGNSLAAHDPNGIGSYWKKSGGKVWPSIGQLRRHLNIVINVRHGVLENWEVVELSLSEIDKCPAIDIIDLMKLLKKSG